MRTVNIIGGFLVCLMVANMLLMRHYFDKLNEPKPIELKLDAPSLVQMQQRLDAMYEECKLRDSAIYREVLNLRNDLNGQKSIDSRDKVAGL
tara:strand:+ start:965 stop:1240 length:276 start_codon:yes stop_codon:yes gene_type:complete